VVSGMSERVRSSYARRSCAESHPQTRSLIDMKFPRYYALVLCLTGLALSVQAQEKPPSPEQVRFFENQVRPLLAEQCHKCHGADKQRGDLRLDSRKAILEGGQSGPALVPGKPDMSRIIDAVNYRNGIEMPPKIRLTPKQVDTLTQWVKMGAPWPDSGETKP